MALKGHCAIALTDTKTGRQTRYEQDNLITNAPCRSGSDRTS